MLPPVNYTRYALIFLETLLGSLAVMWAITAVAPMAAERESVATPVTIAAGSASPTVTSTSVRAAVASLTTTPPTDPPQATAADYAIAQDYCAAVGTVDRFDSRYMGSMPGALRTMAPVALS